MCATHEPSLLIHTKSTLTKSAVENLIDEDKVLAKIEKRLASVQTQKEMVHIENNNNESYISSVGDSADSFNNIAAGDSSPKTINSARKSGRSEDRKGGTALLFTPESSIFPTLDHEIKGAY